MISKLKKLLVVILFLSNYSILIAQEPSKEKYENLFFKMDFETDSVGLNDVREYFFTTFPHNDPTNGNVVYDRTEWQNDGIIKNEKNDGLYGYVKYRSDGKAFDSFRLTSKPYYNLDNDTEKILFVYKGELPSGKGIWPAWWLNSSREDEWLYRLGEKSVTDEFVDTYSGRGEFYNTPSPVNCTDWPSGGEIDIIETINGENLVYNTLHTCPNMCESEWNSNGEIINCANATDEDPNKGCSGVPYKLKEPKGTFALLWEKNALTFFYWRPEDDVRVAGGPLSEKPMPENWKSNIKNSVKLLNTETECTEDAHHDWQCNICEGKDECKFVNLKMVFNVTLCGKWAGTEFDESENAARNCSEFALGVGKDSINDQFMKIEYVAVQRIQ